MLCPPTWEAAVKDARLSRAREGLSLYGREHGGTIAANRAKEVPLRERPLLAHTVKSGVVTVGPQLRVEL
jgi:hypothetical protein